MTEYNEDVLRLCKLHGITILHTRSNFGANITHKVIWVNEQIRSVWTYATALHEIGHIINETPRAEAVMRKWDWYNKRNQDYVTRHVLNSEFAAWSTAKKISKWWNKSADKNAIQSLFTYVMGYNLFHKYPWSGLTNKDIKWYLPIILKDDGLIELCAKEMYG